MPVTIVDHPLVQHKLAIVRNKDTNSKEFRELIKEISTLMAFEAMRDLETEPILINTPLTATSARMLSGKTIALVAILRAGLVMVEGIASMIPTARVGHIGIYRDPKTLEPVEYYSKLPDGIQKCKVFLADPMLATAGSVIKAIDGLKAKGATHIKFIGVVASPEGVAKLQAAHPDVDIVVAAIDKSLNAQGYIVPGLGDAGDRIFGTK